MLRSVEFFKNGKMRESVVAYSGEFWCMLMKIKKNLVLSLILGCLAVPVPVRAPEMSFETIVLELSVVVPTAAAVIGAIVGYCENSANNVTPKTKYSTYATLAATVLGAGWWRYFKPSAWTSDPNISQDVKDQIKARLNDYMSLGDRSEYLKWLGKYPFGKYSKPSQSVDLVSARQQLDSTHVGIDYVKESIVDYLAGVWASGGEAPKVLCFDGVPGTGKTTLGSSIADALGRDFAVVNLSGVKPSELFGELWGNRSPGILAKALIKAGSLNPVILVDELEKSSPEVLAAFLAIFDPSQNTKVRDKYFAFDMDLSRVTFIATVNDLSRLSEPLRNRMQIVHLHPYSIAERKSIARQMLIPQVAESMKLDPAIAKRLDGLVDPLAIKVMKMEGGMRAFKRSLGIAAEKYVRQIIEYKAAHEDGDADLMDHIKDVTCEDVLRSIDPELLSESPSHIVSEHSIVGVANGLQSGDVNGGGLLKVEAIVIPHGFGNLMLGLQDKKSYRQAQQRVFAYVKTIAHDYGIDAEVFKKNDFIFGDQASNVAYSGNWTGLAHAVALVSALTKRPIKQDVAVMGAIDMHGNVLPVTGYRDKILGSEQPGIKNIIVPAAAKATLEAIKDSFPQLNIFYVSTVAEALDLILEK